MQEQITIACGTNEKYAPGLAVTILSLLETTHTPIHLYVIESDLSDDTKACLLSSWKAHAITVQFIRPPVDHIAQFQKNPGITAPQYFRLLIPSVLPESCTKVLYVDSDLLICHDIRELWTIDLGNHPLAAVQDFGVPFVSSEPWGIADHEELGIAPDTPYFNSGVMLLNLPLWREEHIAEQVMQFSSEHTTRLFEQDGCNAILHDRWLPLDNRWNVVLPSLQTFDWWKPNPWQMAHMDLVAADPWIIHFAATKPWQHGCIHANREQFFAVMDRTVWKGWRPG